MIEKRLLQDINRRSQPSDLVTRSTTRRTKNKTKLHRESKRRRQKRMFQRALFLIVVVLLLAGWLTTSIFANATLTVTPRSFTDDVNQVLPAYISPEEGELAFEYVVLSQSGQRPIQSAGLIEEETFASGVVTLFNERSSEQRLQSKTRLQSADGLVFYLPDAGITIPAATGSGPGTVEAMITASAPGESFNLTSGKLHFPGWKESGDTERYEKQYANIEKPLQGGFIGTRPDIDSASLEKITSEVTSEVQTVLMERAEQQQYEGFIAISLPQSFVTSNATSTLLEGKPVAEITGTMAVVLFPEVDFINYVGTYTLAGYDLPIAIMRNPEDLTISIQSLSSGSIQDSSGLTFKITGNLTLDSVVNESALEEAFLGEPKSRASIIIEQFDSIESADLQLRPFWRKKIPNEERKLDIVVEYLT